jgi:hypothetical protein
MIIHTLYEYKLQLFRFNNASYTYVVSNPQGVKAEATTEAAAANTTTTATTNIIIIKSNENMATENGVYNTINTVYDGYYPKRITRRFETVHFSAALFILMHKAVALNTCRVVRKFLAEQ